MNNRRNQSNLSLMDFTRECLTNAEWKRLRSVLNENVYLPPKRIKGRLINNITNPNWQERQNINAIILDHIRKECGPDGDWILEGRTAGLTYQEIDSRNLSDARLETQPEVLTIRGTSIQDLTFKPVLVPSRVDKIVNALQISALDFDPVTNTQADLFKKVEALLQIKIPQKSRSLLLEHAGLVEFSKAGRKKARDKRDHEI